VELYLIRHPKPLIASGICYGQLDMPACPEHLARVAARYCAAIAGLELISSPLKRCQDLAQALGGVTPLKLDCDLKELDFGTWEGQAWDAIDRGQLQIWSEQLLTFRPGGNESLGELGERVKQALERFKGQSNSQVWVTHAGVIRAVLGMALNMPLVDGSRLGLDYGSVSRISLSDSYLQVDFINRLFLDD
jgi:alpha-ribazole phosphatase